MNYCEILLILYKVVGVTLGTDHYFSTGGSHFGKIQKAMKKIVSRKISFQKNLFAQHL